VHIRSLAYATCSAFSALACASSSSRESAAVGTAPVSTSAFVSDRISVVTRGSGPDIILVPGLAAHRDVWALAAESLDARYRLHLVQLWGFAGAAPGGNANGPVAAPVAEEIARYIRETRLARPAIMGHSMGGTIAMMVALRHPPLVGRLMVVDMMPFLGAMFGPSVTTAEGARPMADQMRAQVLAATSGSPSDPLEQMVPAMTRTESMRPVLLQYARTSHRATMANAFHEIIMIDFRPELGGLKMPMTVLYVLPANVPLSRDEFERSLRLSWANAPAARLVRIDASNHYIQLDQPRRFVAEVDALMRR
jgi:pimeloyl-ACP methyl ester carboxylesterase